MENKLRELAEKLKKEAPTQLQAMKYERGEEREKKAVEIIKNIVGDGYEVYVHNFPYFMSKIGDVRFYPTLSLIRVAVKWNRTVGGWSNYVCIVIEPE